MTPHSTLPEKSGVGARDRRATARVGRQARLELTFERRGGRTVIAHAYAEPPFRIGRSFAIGDAAYVIVVCAGPGVFAGDALHQSVRVERGARAVLTSQSALQVHPAAPEAPPGRRLTEAAGAIVHHEYHVAEDAELHCHWDPVIPFADSALAQQFDIALHGGSRLYWSDALMSGRASRGEAWRFRELAHVLRLRVDGSLNYLERYRLTPVDRRVTRPWIADDANYVATTLVHHPRVTADEVDALHRRLAARDDIHLALDLLEPRLMIGRAMAQSGAPFAVARAAMRAAVLESVFQNPCLAGRK
jgi:urease accessory protein UreH